MTEKTYEWFATERGISRETLDAFKVKVDGQDVIFPYDTGEKTRRVYDDGRREFFFTKGRTPCLFHPAKISQTKNAFLVEGETDAMRLWQELRAAGKDTDNTVFGLPGVNTWRAPLAKQLESYERLFVILDNDPDYNVATQVDGAYKSIRDDVGRDKVKRIFLPPGVNDICEFFEVYEMNTLVDLAVKHKGRSRYTPLDLTRPAAPPDWLVNNLFAKGDVTLLAGREGLGKSMLTMALAVALVEGWKTFLGQEVFKRGRVLYIDQENPEDDVRRRLAKLGLKSVGNGALRFLHDQNIRLDRDPDTLLDEALDFEPEAIFIDSLTRVHTQDENNAGQMAALFNDGIQPLARKTGAAVVLIHHDNKGNDPRGSVDITASPDNVLHVQSLGEENINKFTLKQGKTRRRRSGDELVIQIKDMEDGSIQLVSDAVITPPF